MALEPQCCSLNDVSVGQTIVLCRLPALPEGGRPRRAMVCPTKVYSIGPNAPSESLSFGARRSVVPIARLDGQFVRVLQLDLQLMKAAVRLASRNEAQQIMALRGGQLTEA